MDYSIHLFALWRMLQELASPQPSWNPHIRLFDEDCGLRRATFQVCLRGVGSDEVLTPLVSHHCLLFATVACCYAGRLHGFFCLGPEPCPYTLTPSRICVPPPLSNSLRLICRPEYSPYHRLLLGGSWGLRK